MGSGHRLIFSINPGRSGSAYLARLLGTAKEVTSFHEAEPTMTGKYLRMINQFPYPDSILERRVKAGAIKRSLASFPAGQVYCETNHMFIKTFFDVVLEAFENVAVILLRRDPALVLKSFMELGYFSPADSSWPDWMSSPNAKTQAIPCLARDKELDEYDLTIAYLLDIEARAFRFQKEYPGVKIHPVRLEVLNEVSSVEELFRNLRVTPTEETRKTVGQKINGREERKNQLRRFSDLDYCRKRIASYFEKMKFLYGNKDNPGDDLLSHPVAQAVPSALEGLTAVFGMGTGVTPPV